jgi:hypothetical protein
MCAMCRYSPYVLCRNPNVWEDPDSFKPSRFLKNVERKHVLSSDADKTSDNGNDDTNNDGDNDDTSEGGDADGGVGATSSLHRPANVSDFE